VDINGWRRIKNGAEGVVACLAVRLVMCDPEDEVLPRKEKKRDKSVEKAHLFYIYALDNLDGWNNGAIAPW